MPSSIPTFEKILRLLEPDEDKVQAEVMKLKRKEARDMIFIAIIAIIFFFLLVLI